MSLLSTTCYRHYPQLYAINIGRFVENILNWQCAESAHQMMWTWESWCIYWSPGWCCWYCRVLSMFVGHQVDVAGIPGDPICVELTPVAAQPESKYDRTDGNVLDTTSPSTTTITTTTATTNTPTTTTSTTTPASTTTTTTPATTTATTTPVITTTTEKTTTTTVNHIYLLW